LPTGGAIPAAAVVDDLLARIFTHLAADLREEGHEARNPPSSSDRTMVVALRALDADAKERLRGVFRELERIVSNW